MFFLACDKLSHYPPSGLRVPTHSKDKVSTLDICWDILPDPEYHADYTMATMYASMINNDYDLTVSIKQTLSILHISRGIGRLYRKW